MAVCLEYHNRKEKQQELLYYNISLIVILYNQVLDHIM